MKKVLYLCARLFPLHSGDAIYSYGIIERLTEYAQIDLVAYANLDLVNEQNRHYSNLTSKINEIKLVDLNILRDYKLKNIIRFGHEAQYYSKEYVDQVLKLASNKTYDLIVVDSLRLAYIYKILRKVCIGSKLILVQHNVEYQNFQEVRDYISSSKGKLKCSMYNYNLKKLEDNSIKHFDYIWCISNYDKQYFDRILKKQDKTFVLPPYFKYDAVKTIDDLKENTFNLLFLGKMDWYPNVQGIKWFVENAFNKLVDIDSRYKLYIVGNSPTEEIQKLANNNIIVTGRVENVYTYVKNCDLMISPLFMGGGVKIKVMESILKGIPVIATPKSIEGYPLTLFNNDFCVENGEEFVNSILKINASFETKCDFIKKARNILQELSDISKIMTKI